MHSINSFVLVSLLTFSSYNVPLHVYSFSPHSIKKRTSPVGSQKLNKNHRFVPPQTFVVSQSFPRSGRQSSLQSTTESEVEALLRKARELRAQAQQDEAQLHSTLIEKKQEHDNDTDAVIDKLFPASDGYLPKLKIDADDKQKEAYRQKEGQIVNAIVDRLHQHQYSTDKLKDVVSRLVEREVSARGLKHVEPNTLQGHVAFEVVASPNDEELKRVEGLAERLVEAAKVIDEEYWKEKRVKGEDLKLHHSDVIHWTTGNLSTILKEKLGFLGREHDEQFKKRSEDYYEAARRKDKDEKKK